MPKETEEFPEAVRLITMIVVWYVLAALASSAMKQLLMEFAHPLSLSLCQFVCATTLCLARAAMAPAKNEVSAKCQPMTMSFRGLCNIASQYRVLGLQLGAGVIMTSVCHRFALMLMPVSFTHTIKALQPLYAAALSKWFLGTSCPRDRCAALVIIVTGVGLSAYSELDYTWSGVAFAQLSVLAIVTSSVLQKRYLRCGASTSNHHSLDKPVLLSLPYASSPELTSVPSKCESSPTNNSNRAATCAPPSNLDTNSVFFLTNAFALALLFPAWCIFDTNAIYDLRNSRSGCLRTVAVLICTSFFVVAQHFASISVLEIASTAVTHAVASTFKRIFVITTSIIWFGNNVAPLNAFGIFLSVCGVALYDRSSKAAAKRSSHHHHQTTLNDQTMQRYEQQQQQHPV